MTDGKTLAASGAKCDVCGYEDMGGVFHAFKLYRKPCPKCGSILIRGRDLGFLIVIMFIGIFIWMPLELFIRFCTNIKPKKYRFHSFDGGKTYKCEVEEDHEKQHYAGMEKP